MRFGCRKECLNRIEEMPTNKQAQKKKNIGEVRKVARPSVPKRLAGAGKLAVRSCISTFAGRLEKAPQKNAK
ncbi:hypothetical protein AHMF7605_22325 [Adhaeribacter arboris]|uniref:Uncharacterized protein n=1 Tax=Adhaeribacter arboris TaxID=2072846 RepID=A0A2T2YKK8_9BACT|nr:hypothetical protein AHMF7605_22325 [Adhaeribacter arboris]